MPMKNVN